MNFLYDLTATQSDFNVKFHGGGTYGEIIFFKLLEIFNSNTTVIFAAYDSKRYINPDLLENAKQKGVTLIDINSEGADVIFEKYKITRFYSALLDEFIPWDLSNCEVITTLHDLRGLEIPIEAIALKYETTLKDRAKTFAKLYLLKNYYIKKIYKGYTRFFDGKKKIITVSQHSKASILSFFPNTASENIKVFYSPTFEQLKKDFISPANFTELSKKYNNIERKKYFLLTSAARWLKNALRAVFAFDALLDDGKLSDFKIVLTGVLDKSIFEKRIRNKNSFVFAEYIDRPELESLNQNAYAFIYPSLNEGFGYPPIDAMKYGVPVAASGTSSIPEICGDAALYFDPYNSNEIKDRIIQLLDLNIYTMFSQKAKEQYEKISEKQEKDLHDCTMYLLSEKL